eukprot:CAMPEP_0119058054 /NCGR_PEP_ID=MMETSP1178-20130426/2421_1 /TAXON_ID=33656 /ORGANISM="unid sp, Strain CCMP2000" /LENGTH=44 /DNA_ID= /DNA_START= /DNA_END= /DNA_ORIENTATION=
MPIRATLADRPIDAHEGAQLLELDPMPRAGTRGFSPRGSGCKCS